MAKAVAPHLVKQGLGRIVNITTSHFTMVMDGFSPYGPSKAAMEAATVIWSKDLAGTGVTVNALLPGGAANTRMIPQGDLVDRSTLVQPEVMMAPIVWLMSPRSNGVTGRRIIAKEWDAARLASTPADQVGSPRVVSEHRPILPLSPSPPLGGAGTIGRKGAKASEVQARWGLGHRELLRSLAWDTPTGVLSKRSGHRLRCSKAREASCGQPLLNCASATSAAPSSTPRPAGCSPRSAPRRMTPSVRSARWRGCAAARNRR